MIKISQSSLTLHSFASTQARKKLGPQHLASAAAIPSCGTAALLGSSDACNAWSKFQNISQSSLTLDSFSRTQARKETPATAPSLCSCYSFLWYSCFAWVFWCLQCMMKIAEWSLAPHSFARTQARKKLGPQHLASTAATPSCGSTALLGSAGACSAWSTFHNQVSLFTLSQQRKHEQKLGQQHLASAAATPSCGSTALLGSSCASNWWSKLENQVSLFILPQAHSSTKRNSSYST